MRARRCACRPSTSSRFLSASVPPPSASWLSYVMMMSVLRQEEFLRPQHKRWSTPRKGKYIYMHMYAWICIYMHMYACICIYMYKKNVRKRPEARESDRKGRDGRYSRQEPPLLRGSLWVSASAHTSFYPFWGGGVGAASPYLFFRHLGSHVCITACSFLTRPPSPSLVYYFCIVGS